MIIELTKKLHDPLKKKDKNPTSFILFNELLVNNHSYTSGIPPVSLPYLKALYKVISLSNVSAVFV